jgi:lysozyme
MATLKKKAGWAAIAVTIVGGFEGIRTVAYLDPIGIPTACFGETKGIRMGQKFTMAECESMLIESLKIADDAVMHCTKVPLSDTRRAALVSFTYNVGGHAYCNSTLVKKLNAGDTVGACDQLLRWDRAKGIRLPGLTKRRAAERDLCMRGLM